MITLQEMYERRDELKAKQEDSKVSFYSEDQAALVDVVSLIDLRVKYLHRYINHHPFARTAIAEEMKKFIMSPNNQETKAAIASSVNSIVRSWVANRDVACKTDGDDLVSYFLTNMVLE